MTDEPMVERFWAKVNKDGPVPRAGTMAFQRGIVSPCWLWTAYLDRQGYGRFWDGVRTPRAHRWAYEHFVRPVPEGLVTDHLCRVRNCVNPEHLEPVTSRENNLRGETIVASHASKTHCPRGIALEAFAASAPDTEGES